MKIKKVLAGAMLVLGLAGGEVAVAASVASADTFTHTSPAGSTTATDTPENGQIGQPGDKPPAGVGVTKGEGGVLIGQPGDKPPAGVGVTKGEAATPAK
ncbi:hypothetical protein [Amycolatopsis pigmentata]|uniref:Small secreted domain n=1 Tax=Amycolatopsis pigmentata TaxID=450801 RepID=A0ABW5FJ00_9PSEU